VKPPARPRGAEPLRIRRLSNSDLPAVTRIDAHHTGQRKPSYWRGVLSEFLGRRSDGRARVGLAAQAGRRVVGYLLGEVRAFEFGSEPCGWIFAVGVDPSALRGGVGAALLEEACRAFHQAGLARVRTMVRRSDVPVLAFFRSSGFAGGAYVQLELDVSHQP
jgi:ribosomal protein S18 acetylase RimI-like enzyme